ncbi:MAG: type IV pilus assembly protein PilM [Planctomycetaceae bacterium]
MAETNRAVWGIDVGQSALKAIKIRYLEGTGQCAAMAFDYVPFPKILSQPDAIPDELIPEAINTFLSRNDVKDDLIAISVPGQMALTRFIQLPPVESGKLAEIVKYEAKQQIPFALDEVIWDYQPIGSGVEESGYLLDAEVGLFAMKKEQVYQQMRPFQNAKLELELIQIAPLALYNMLCYDEFNVRPGQPAPDGEENVIVLDMGCDNTTLIVSNGSKIWIRNVPLGGNHFTRALTKEMKLSFAKAEHLKLNATKSPDPRAVFQALRPVFNDYVSEIQRSIGFFSSVNRSAKIRKVVGLGNGFKLAGLQKFLEQNLQYDVERPDTFPGLVGDAVLNSPLFADNMLSFAVPYGLALQALGLTSIKTTLLPQEIATERIIRRKKPWAVAAAASLLVGLSMSMVVSGNSLRSASNPEFERAIEAANAFNSKIGSAKSAYDAKLAALEAERGRVRAIVAGLRDDSWMEIYGAINACLPRDTVSGASPEKPVDQREQITIVQINNRHVAEVGDWYKTLKVGGRDLFLSKWDKENPPTGEGYIFSLDGLHYHHGEDSTKQLVQYVQNTLLANLQEWEVQPIGYNAPVPIAKLGIKAATIRWSDDYTTVLYDPVGRVDAKASRLTSGQRPGGGLNGEQPGFNPGIDPMGIENGTNPPPNSGTLVELKQSHFVIEFVVQYVKPDAREPRAPWDPAPAETSDGSTTTEGTETPAADGSTPATDPMSTDPMPTEPMP